MNDHELALEIATRAGEIVIEIRNAANIDPLDEKAAKETPKRQSNLIT
jgi:hypothetical protein